MNVLKRAAALAALLALSALLAFVLGVLWPLETLRPVVTTTPIVIRDVAIVDVEEGRIESPRTVVIEGSTIRSTGAAAAIPSAARLIDGRGKFLMPALWDMHAHLYAIGPLLDQPLYIAYGVTNVRDMQSCPSPDDPFVACAEEKRKWTKEAIAGRRIAPRVIASASWMANGPGMVKRLGNVPPYFDTATPDQARQFVRHFVGKADAIKVYDKIPRPAYLALAEEARRYGLEVVGHRPHAVSAMEAAAHQKSIEHARFILHESYPGSAELRQRAPRDWREDRRRMLDLHDPAMAHAIFQSMQRHGTWYVPTHLTRWADAYAETPAVRQDPLLRYLHPLMKRQWIEDLDEVLKGDPSPAERETYREFYRKGLELTGAAHRAGVRILAGTDSIIPGADLHRELRLLVAAGLSPSAALRAATVGPAEYFGLRDRYGSVAPGKTADLILLDADPLRDIRNSERISAVVFNGNFYDRAALDRIQAHVQRRARSWSAGCKLVWRFLKNPAFY